MIFAAGLGTRLAPLTTNTPKALVKLKGKSLLWHVTEKLADEGFDSITINTHHFAQQICDYIVQGDYNSYLTQRGISVFVSDETDLLLDTGGGLKKAAPHIFCQDEAPVLIHNVDIMSNARLSHIYQLAQNSDAMLLVSKRDTARYLLFDSDMRMVGWKNIQTGEVKTPYANLNVKKCQHFAFSGIQVVGKKVTDAMKEWPDRFGIMDFYIKMCAQLRIVGYVQPDLKLVDIGKIDVLRKLEEEE